MELIFGPPNEEYPESVKIKPPPTRLLQEANIDEDDDPDSPFMTE